MLYVMDLLQRRRTRVHVHQTERKQKQSHGDDFPIPLTFSPTPSQNNILVRSIHKKYIRFIKKTYQNIISRFSPYLFQITSS